MLFSHRISFGSKILGSSLIFANLWACTQAKPKRAPEEPAPSQPPVAEAPVQDSTAAVAQNGTTGTTLGTPETTGSVAAVMGAPETAGVVQITKAPSLVCPTAGSCGTLVNFSVSGLEAGVVPQELNVTTTHQGQNQSLSGVAAWSPTPSTPQGPLLGSFRVLAPRGTKPDLALLQLTVKFTNGAQIQTSVGLSYTTGSLPSCPGGSNGNSEPLLVCP